MLFQAWIRDLLCDAVSRNRAHVIARMSPTDLRSLCEQDLSPSIDAILAYCENVKNPKAASSHKFSRQPSLINQKQRQPKRRKTIMSLTAEERDAVVNELKRIGATLNLSDD